MARYYFMLYIHIMVMDVGKNVLMWQYVANNTCTNLIAHDIVSISPTHQPLAHAHVDAV